MVLSAVGWGFFRVGMSQKRSAGVQRIIISILNEALPNSPFYDFILKFIWEK
jgi:hypothetical protein